MEHKRWYPRHVQLRLLVSLSCVVAVLVAYSTPLDGRQDGVGHVPFLELDAHVVVQCRKQEVTPADILMDGLLRGVFPLAALGVCIGLDSRCVAMVAAGYLHLLVFPRARDQALYVAETLDEYCEAIVQIDRGNAWMLLGTLLPLVVNLPLHQGVNGFPVLGAVALESPRRAYRTQAAQKSVRVRIGDGPYAVVTKGDLKVVCWGTVPLHAFHVDDRLGQYVAAVDLVHFRKLPKRAVAKAMELSERSIFRLLKRFEDAGVEGLLGRKGGRKPTKLIGESAIKLAALKRQGASQSEAARRLGVSRSAVGSALRRAGGAKPQGHPSSPSLKTVNENGGAAPAASEAAGDGVPALVPAESSSLAAVGRRSAEESRPVVESPVVVMEHSPSISSSQSTVVGSSPVVVPEPAHPTSFDLDPTNRSQDRFLARMGLLSDAAPLFAAGVLAGAGVLLAVPLLVQSGIFENMLAVYGRIGPAFYGTRTITVAYLLMSLLRIKRPENLKKTPPRTLGRIFGLDRAPEMKTLRGKLRLFALMKKSLELMRRQGKVRAAQQAAKLAYLCIDGHVRSYHGKLQISKAYVMQRRRAVPGTTDYWVGDQRGHPLLVVTAEGNEGLTKMLRPVLAEVRKTIGDRKATIVFDRGGNAACRIMPSGGDHRPAPSLSFALEELDDAA